MSFQFVTLEEARKSTDLVPIASAPGVPNPRVEAVKGIFHAKQVPFVAVHTNYDDPEFMEWAGSRGAPVVLHGGRSPIDR